MDLSIIKHLSTYCKIIYLLDIPPYLHKSSALQIDKIYPKSGIFKSDIYPALSDWKNYIKTEDFYVINRTSKKSYSPTNIRLQKMIVDFINDINPDIIHSSNFLGFYYFYFLLKKRKKTIITVHDPLPHSGESSRRETLIRKINYKFIKNIILLNKNQLPLFINITKRYKFKNIFLSSLGVYEYLNRYIKPIKKDETDNKFTFLFFGRISPYKGIDLLLDAFVETKKMLDDIELIVAGRGKYWFDISNFKQHKDIKIINRYIPNDELVQLIQNASIVICPYKDATQSGVVMSAFALNKPVIATCTGGIPEMVTDKKTGYLIEVNNINALCDSMLYITTHPEELDIMSENIKKEYTTGSKSWHVICGNLFENYKKLTI
jgi:glycosyltransferase involved in cell wall biosynthesis